MAKIPKWKRDFNRRMAQQLRDFAKSKDKNLTQFTYTNGKFVEKQVWGRVGRRRRYYKERQWIPSTTTQAPS
jgi:hypothetical protein